MEIDQATKIKNTDDMKMNKRDHDAKNDHRFEVLNLRQKHQEQQADKWHLSGKKGLRETCRAV